MIPACSRGMKACLARSASRSSFVAGRQPNPPLHLDPSLQNLLRDADMSLLGQTNLLSHRELEVFPGNTSHLPTSHHIEPCEESAGLGKKSPAAEFGSEKIGAVVLPPQLASSINLLIQDSNKALLHVDAKRLFLNEDGPYDAERGWDTRYDVRYRSRRQRTLHAERDGVAFASIAFPAHYSAILAVLHHLRKRLGPSWSAQNVIEWGAGTGSGLWASVHTFLPKPEQDSMELQDLRLSGSSIARYIGIDKRDGLTSIGKRLVNNIDSGDLRISWQRGFQDGNKTEFEGRQTLGLSAFVLSSLPTSIARKMLVKEMWESGAEVMVLIDHKTALGFEAIAEAREYLLNLGKKELEDVPDKETCHARKGSHVVAPCPHDAPCPLYHGGSSRLSCGFSQRIQRPDFVRRTKHSKIGHENVEYSYVVVRRGARPSIATTQAGRIGEVGLRELQRSSRVHIPIKELTLHDGSEPTSFEPDAPQVPEGLGSLVTQDQELEAALRQESFNWPRLVFPPLKRSGHIILDGCTAEGKIMRMIIPRSQGKQPYYDARKSSSGDIFPHQPKNPGQERNLGSNSKGKHDMNRKARKTRQAS